MCIRRGGEIFCYCGQNNAEDRRSECSDLLTAETAGANQRAVQVRYRLPIGEKNPHKEGTSEYDAFHRGYEFETMIGG